MQSSDARDSRRSFLRVGLAVAGGALLVGCDGGSDKEITVTKQEDPAARAKDSMAYYQQNQLKKKKK